MFDSYECTSGFRISLKSVRYEKVIDQKNNLISRFPMLTLDRNQLTDFHLKSVD